MKTSLALGLTALFASAANAAEPPPIADFVRHSTYSSADISPNGEYLALTVDRGGQDVLTVLRNAVKWAYNPGPAWTAVTDAPNVPVEKALEPITERGPKLHQAGEEGYR